jgi:hypothetical protein
MDLLNLIQASGVVQVVVRAGTTAATKHQFFFRKFDCSGASLLQRENLAHKLSKHNLTLDEYIARAKPGRVDVDYSTLSPVLEKSALPFALVLEEDGRLPDLEPNEIQEAAAMTEKLPEDAVLPSGPPTGSSAKQPAGGGTRQSSSSSSSSSSSDSETYSEGNTQKRRTPFTSDEPLGKNGDHASPESTSSQLSDDDDESDLSSGSTSFPDESPLKKGRDSALPLIEPLVQTQPRS